MISSISMDPMFVLSFRPKRVIHLLLLFLQFLFIYLFCFIWVFISGIVVHYCAETCLWCKIHPCHFVPVHCICAFFNSSNIPQRTLCCYYLQRVLKELLKNQINFLLLAFPFWNFVSKKKFFFSNFIMMVLNDRLKSIIMTVIGSQHVNWYVVQFLSKYFLVGQEIDTFRTSNYILKIHFDFINGW